VLPMFTSTPVRNIVSTMFDRPYETNGSVSPVVGEEPDHDADVQVRRDHRDERESDRDQLEEGERAWRAIRKPSSA
jgi:hypothetical protein